MTTTKRWYVVAVPLLLVAMAACQKKRVQAPAPPAPKQNVFALLPEADGKVGAIAVTNPAGSQELRQANQAVRVERADVAPSSPFLLDDAAVKRLFGSALEVLPEAEVRFVLYFVEGTDGLTAESTAQLPAIQNTVRQRRSTAISLIGHTDTTGDRQANFQLGLRRAERVAGILKGTGVEETSLFVESHGEADLAVKTPRGVAEQRNRRVEVIVR
jgi:outer membrane protein OmpA-like peptidoglycan-associated protein